MSQTVLLSVGAGIAGLLIMSALVLMYQSRQQDRIAARVRMVQGLPQVVVAPVERESVRVASVRAIASLGQLILRSGVLSARTRAEFANTLATAGLHGPNGLAVFVGGKILLTLGLPVLAWVLQHQGIRLPGMLGTLMIPGAAVLGLLAPDWLLGRKRKKYQQRLERGLPDALDMMVICAQAGLGLGAAIIRVATEMQGSHWEVSQELSQTASELQILSDSRIALTNLGNRTGIDGYKRLGSTLVQTMQYGTPLTDALRALAAEMRQDLLTKFEARAARLPVLLTMPTLLFILPCVFLIAGGPAIIKVMRAFH
jgi:tight adherence protein C